MDYAKGVRFIWKNCWKILKTRFQNCAKSIRMVKFLKIDCENKSSGLYFEKINI